MCDGSLLCGFGKVVAWGRYLSLDKVARPSSSCDLDSMTVLYV